MKKGIIITSFGTTYKKTRELCIESVEDLAREIYPEDLVLRAFTSRMIIDILKNRDGLAIDNPTEALNRLKDEGIREAYLQPLLIIEGHEYDKTLGDVEDFLKQNKDFKVRVGQPLLTTEDSYEDVIRVLDLDKIGANEVLIYMGHGSDHQADDSYEILEKKLREAGYDNVFVGTVEGKRSLEDILAEIKGRKIEKIYLKPFMLVAGDHATNDMASDEEDSWKGILRAAGYEVEPILEGLGENPLIRDLFMGKLKEMRN